MKYYILIIMFAIATFAGVYYVTLQTPKPGFIAISSKLPDYLDFTPVIWDYEFGEKTVMKDGTPAMEVIYTVNTPSSKEKKIITLKLLFFKDGDRWETEKIE